MQVPIANFSYFPLRSYSFSLICLFLFYKDKERYAKCGCWGFGADLRNSRENKRNREAGQSQKGEADESGTRTARGLSAHRGRMASRHWDPWWLFHNAKGKSLWTRATMIIGLAKFAGLWMSTHIQKWTYLQVRSNTLSFPGLNLSGLES